MLGSVLKIVGKQLAIKLLPIIIREIVELLDKDDEKKAVSEEQKEEEKAPLT